MFSKTRNFFGHNLIHTIRVALAGPFPFFIRQIPTIPPPNFPSAFQGRQKNEAILSGGRERRESVRYSCSADSLGTLSGFFQDKSDATRADDATQPSLISCNLLKQAFRAASAVAVIVIRLARGVPYSDWLLLSLFLSDVSLKGLRHPGKSF